MRRISLMLVMSFGLSFAGFQAATPAGSASDAGPLVSEANVAMAAGYRREEVAAGLAHPWGMAWLPDGRLLVTERPGRLRVVADGELRPEPIRGLPEVYAQGQGGLLDVAVDPDFAANRRIYLSYVHGSRFDNRLRVLRAVLADGALSDVTVIFENPQAKTGTQHFGSRFVWLSDRTLLFSVGDGGNPPIRLDGGWIREQAQQRASLLGKIVRITTDGAAPDDNPFVGDPTADPRVFSYGHRNVQGLARDPATGRIWASEHGALGGDELNRIRPGGNYGWPRATWSREYFGGRISDHRALPGMVDPVLVWKVAIAPSGMTVYDGDRFPQWRGNLFVAGLVSQDVRRIVLSSDGRVAGEEAIRIGTRARSVAQGPDGLLYVLTDDDAGRLLRIIPADADAETAP